MKVYHGSSVEIIDIDLQGAHRRIHRIVSKTVDRSLSATFERIKAGEKIYIK
jgi:hypothetical protein